MISIQSGTTAKVNKKKEKKKEKKKKEEEVSCAKRRRGKFGLFFFSKHFLMLI